jgi:undecaprenyl-diphosphatase
VDFRGLDTISDGLFALGLWPAFVIVGAVVSVTCWHARQRLAAAFAVLALLAAGTSWLLKLLIERPRPSADIVRVIGEPGGYSFPSGHVLGAVLLWGFVFYVTPRVLSNQAAGRAVRALSLGVLLLMGLQRVYAGAHWPSDVVGGYLWGGLILALIIGAFEFSQRRAGSGVGPA